MSVSSASLLGISTSLLGNKASLLERNLIDIRNIQEYNKTIIIDYINRPDEELLLLYPDADFVKQAAQEMERKKIGPFKNINNSH